MNDMNEYPTVWDVPPNPPQPPMRRPARLPRWLVIGGVALAFVFALGVGVLIGTAAMPSFANADLSAGQGHSGHSGVRAGGAGQAGFAGVGAHGRGRGLTVVSLNSDGTISATRTDRSGATTTVTIKTTATTQYLELGKTIDRSALVKGTVIGVQGTRNSDGSITATRVEVILPSYHGAVTGVSGSDITVKDPRSGATHVIHTDANTTFMRGSQSSSLSAVQVNDQIDAAGTLNSDNTLTAQVVHLVLPRAGGKILTISGSTVTVQDRRGTATIHLQADTQYFTVTKGTSGPTQTAATVGDLAVGKYIQAEGTKNSDGSLNAETVRIVPAPAAGGSGGPRFGPGAPGGQGGWPGTPPSA